MAQGLIHIFTGGGIPGSLLKQITADIPDVLDSKFFVDGNGITQEGTMPDNGAWSATAGVGQTITVPSGYHNGKGTVKDNTANKGAWNGTVGVNGSVTIPEGYHNGQGEVTNSVATMGAQTITPSSSQQTISCSRKYMTGNIVIKAAGILKYKSYTGQTKQGTKSFTRTDGRSITLGYKTITGFGFTPKIAFARYIGRQAIWTCYDSNVGQFWYMGAGTEYIINASGNVGNNTITFPMYSYVDDAAWDIYIAGW